MTIKVGETTELLNILRQITRITIDAPVGSKKDAYHVTLEVKKFLESQDETVVKRISIFNNPEATKKYETSSGALLLDAENNLSLEKVQTMEDFITILYEEVLKQDAQNS